MGMVQEDNILLHALDMGVLRNESMILQFGVQNLPKTSYNPPGEDIKR